MTPEFPPERQVMSPVDKLSWPIQRSSTSIFVMYWPGTTISPKKRLVMSIFRFAVEDAVEDDSAAAFTALEVGWRYSYDWAKMILHS